MPEEKVLAKVKPMVLAEYHPAVVAIDPHAFPFSLPPVCFGGNSRTHGKLDTRAAASISARKRTTCVGRNRLLFSRRFLILEGARQGVSGLAARDRPTSAGNSALGVVGLVPNPRRVGRLEGRDDTQSNNCDDHG
jgi:hypothetical protein